MTLHELKTWTYYFRQVWMEDKLFELRKADRDFKRGDTLLLREYDLSEKTYSGREILAKVTCVAGPGEFGLNMQTVCMGIRVLERYEKATGQAKTK